MGRQCCRRCGRPVPHQSLRECAGRGAEERKQMSEEPAKRPTLRALLAGCLLAFREAGGTNQMLQSGTYPNGVLAYYAGQTVAFNRVLYSMDQPTWPTELGFDARFAEENT